MEYSGFTLMQVLGLTGGIIGVSSAIIAFLIKRGIFQEIDDLKNKKQDKFGCIQQKALCSQEIDSLCSNVTEIKTDLKEGRKEFKAINRKMDRLMGFLKLQFDDLNGE